MILGLCIGSYYEQPFPSEPWDFGTTSPIRVRNGTVRAPSGSGLGMTLDMDSIDDATLARYSATR
jgi:L-alanine-DL-glutamate epimerase-like enolase superfamily enzyme